MKIQDKTLPAEAYDGQYYQADKTYNRIKYLKATELADLKQEHTVLDFGCGLGRLEAEIWTKVNSIYAIDYSEDGIHYCKSNNQFQNIIYKCGGITDLNYTFKFDRIFLIDVVEHLSKDDLFTLMYQIDNLLTNTGKIIIHTDIPSARIIKILLQWVKFNFTTKLVEDKHHVYIYSNKELKEVMERFGFKTKIFNEKVTQRTFFNTSQWCILTKDMTQEYLRENSENAG